MAEKELINVVFIGHVDHGKSTTVGRLLYDGGALSEQEYRKLEEEFSAHGFTAPQLEHPQGGIKRAKATPEQIEDARRKVQRDLRRGFWLRWGMAAVAALAIVVVLMAAFGP